MKRWHWIIPPVLVVAGYFSTDVVMPGVRAEREAAGAEARKERREERRRYTIDQAREQFNADCRAEAAPDSDDLRALDIGQLRQRVLDQFERYRSFEDELNKANEDVKDLEDAHEVGLDFDFCRQELEKAAEELVRREKGRACEWLEKEAPRLRLVAIHAWAIHEPEAAWDAILRSKRVPPCDIMTIGRLLMQKESDPAGLKEACMQVPWDRLTMYHPPGDELRAGGEGILGTYTAFQPAVSFTAWRPWIESGAGLALAEKGVGVRSLLQSWSEEEPVAAIKAWAEWPDMGESGGNLLSMLPSPNLAGLLKSSEISQQVENVAALLKGLPPQQRARAVREFENYAKRYGANANVMKPYFEALEIPIPAADE